MSPVAQTFRVLRLLWGEERRNLQVPLLNGLLLPATMAYLGLRTIESPERLRIWLAGSITLALGLNGLTQVGSAALIDRFKNRLALLRTAPVPKYAYYAARLVLAAAESLALVVGALALFTLLGIGTPSAGGLAAGVLAAVCAGASLGGLGAMLAFRVRDFDTGITLVTLAALGLGAASPVLYSVDAVPAVLRPVVWLSPFTYLAPLVRAAVDGQGVPLWAAAGSVTLAAALNVLSFRGLRWHAA